MRMVRLMFLFKTSCVIFFIPWVLFYELEATFKFIFLVYFIFFTLLSILSGFSGNSDSGKKKILLLKGKEREIIAVSL